MKKNFKKLLKKIDKSRKKYGFSNEGISKSHISIPPQDPTVIMLYKCAIVFNDTVDLIRDHFDGIPEFLDKKCLQESGMRLQDLTNFFTQFIVRMSLAQFAETDEKRVELLFGDLQTLSYLIDGKPVIDHQSKEDNEEFQRLFTMFRESPTKIFEFMEYAIEYSQTLNKQEQN